MPQNAEITRQTPSCARHAHSQYSTCTQIARATWIFSAFNIDFIICRWVEIWVNHEKPSACITRSWAFVCYSHTYCISRMYSAINVETCHHNNNRATPMVGDTACRNMPNLESTWNVDSSSRTTPKWELHIGVLFTWWELSWMSHWWDTPSCLVVIVHAPVCVFVCVCVCLCAWKKFLIDRVAFNVPWAR